MSDLFALGKETTAQVNENCVTVSQRLWAAQIRVRRLLSESGVRIGYLIIDQSETRFRFAK